MAKQYAIMHTSKIKSSGGLGNHIDRVEGKEYTFKNADPERGNLNQEFCKEYEKLSLPTAIHKRTFEGYTSEKAIRKDAVKALGTIYTGTHEQMKKIEGSEGELQKWVQANYDFACKEFGQENIVRFTLHRDELTPHIHCVHVPITDKGTLSAKEVMGGRTEMKERQSRYAQQMMQFGLKRGEERSKSKHQTTAEYYRIQNTVEKDFDIIASKEVSMFERKKYIEIIQDALKSNILQLKQIELESQKRQSKLHSAELSQKRSYKLAQDHYKGKIQIQGHLMKILKDPGLYQKEAEKLSQKQQKKSRGKDTGFDMN